MDNRKKQELNDYLKALDLPFSHALVEAIMRDDLAGKAENADDLAKRLYGLSGSVLPGLETPLQFEQLLFDVFKGLKTSFSMEEDEIVAPLRKRLLSLLDKWLQLNDFLQKKENSSLPGRDGMERELAKVLCFSQDLLDRANHPEKENPGSLAELELLLEQQEAFLFQITEELDSLLNPEKTCRDAGETETILTLKVSLRGLPEPIWRRLRVSAAVNLEEFHSILQRAMGWWDLYDHQFEQAGRIWKKGNGDADDSFEPEEQAVLGDLLEEGDDAIHYLYDMPEGWDHQILLEKKEECPASGRIVLECLEGNGACPPEDCGGPSEYLMLLASLAPDAPAALKEDYAWASDHDPDDFSLMELNRDLQDLF